MWVNCCTGLPKLRKRGDAKQKTNDDERETYISQNIRDQKRYGNCPLCNIRDENKNQGENRWSDLYIGMVLMLTHAQFSSVPLTFVKNASALAPSKMRWSKTNDRYTIGRMAMVSSLSPSSAGKTTTRFCIAPTPKIPHCGWLMTGNANKDPLIPWLVRVKVPPLTSSG